VDLRFARLVVVDERDAWLAALPGEDVAEVEPLGRGDVARLRLADGSTVIVKKQGRDARNGADERAALLFLADHFRTPSVLMVDDTYLVLEDVSGPSIAELLLGENRDAAAHGLVELGRALGELHAWSRARLPEYAARRAAAGPPRTRELRHRPTARATLRARLDEGGLPAPDGLDADHDVVDRVISDSGRFRALVHGDPCPDNAIVRPDGSVTLIDFEWSMVGHALLDGVYVEVPFPTCWCYGIVPDDVVASVGDAYREALGLDADDRTWDAAVTAASASWWLAGIDEFLAPGFGQDTAWGTAGLRQRILHRSGRFAALSERTGQLLALGTAARSLVSRLESDWAVPPLEPYPAFR
jgi:tRNA A-37 threonylcarbamoyl transferase component Bud32